MTVNVDSHMRRLSRSVKRKVLVYALWKKLLLEVAPNAATLDLYGRIHCVIAEGEYIGTRTIRESVKIQTATEGAAQVFIIDAVQMYAPRVFWILCRNCPRVYSSVEVTSKHNIFNKAYLVYLVHTVHLSSFS